CFGLWCSRVSGSGAGLGVLLGPDFLTRRGIHARVRAQIRFPQKSPLGGRLRRGLSSGTLFQRQLKASRDDLREHANPCAWMLVLAAAMSAVGGFLQTA